MALRILRTDPDEILHKTSRRIDKINQHILTLLDDMAETMYAERGLGLAAVQIGVLRRAVVIDVGEGLLKMVNPVITEKSEETECDVEGCLSFPGYQGLVDRPKSVCVEYTNEKGEQVYIENATGLFKKALCHELDHLDGVVYTDIAEKIYEISDEDDEETSDEEAAESEAQADNKPEAETPENPQTPKAKEKKQA